MYLEAALIVSDWLKHPEYGVNAMIDDLDLDTGDEAPPAIVDIVNEAEDIEVAGKKEPQNCPAIYVMVDDPIIIDTTIGSGVKQRITDLPVAIRYIIINTDLVTLRRETMYTLRAIKRSLWRLDKNANVNSRTRNGICIIRAVNLIVMEIRESLGDATVVGAIVVTYEADDTDP